MAIQSVRLFLVSVTKKHIDTSSNSMSMTILSVFIYEYRRDFNQGTGVDCLSPVSDRNRKEGRTSSVSG